MIDLLPYVPKKTESGYDVIITKPEKGWLELYYKHPRIKPFRLRRFVDPKILGALFGQYQAEGTKHQNSKYRKRSFEFTNKLIAEHEEFVRHLEYIGIKRTNMFCVLSDSDNRDMKVLKKLARKYENKISVKPKIVYNPSKRGGWAYKTLVRNTLLTEFMLSLMDILRKKAIKNPVEMRPFLNTFFAKALTGDGTFGVDGRKYPRTQITLKDKDMETLEDYSKIMNIVGFNYIRIYKKYNSVEAKCSFKNLLYLYKIRAFENTNNWNKILVTIGRCLTCFRTRTKWRFVELEDKPFFTIKDIVEMYNLHPNDMKWIRNMRNTDYIKRIDEKPPHKYIMTEKAHRLKETLKDWKRELDKLVRLKGIDDLMELHQSLKLRPRLSK